MTKTRKKVFKGGSAKAINFKDIVNKFLNSPRKATQRKCTNISVLKKAVEVLEDKLAKCNKKNESLKKENESLKKDLGV